MKVERYCCRSHMRDTIGRSTTEAANAKVISCSAHPGERDAAVTAAGALSGLLVEVRHKLASGRLHHLGLVRLGVVGMTPSVGYAPVAANHLGAHAMCDVVSPSCHAKPSSLSSHVIVGGKNR